MTSRRGGSTSRMTPESKVLPSSDTYFHGAPAVHSLSQDMPNQYCFMNSVSVSAFHSFSGVVRMKVTYTNWLRFAVFMVFPCGGGVLVRPLTPSGVSTRATP